MPPVKNVEEIIGHFPNICGREKEVLKYSQAAEDQYAPISNIPFDRIQSAFGVALHMHQPTIPAGSDDLEHAALVSNLQYMVEHQDVGDNHNATVFLQCYTRMSDMIRDLVDQGKNPRIMLDYSGNLLWGLRQMGQGQVLDNLKKVSSDKKYFQNVEWLGTTWSHAVVTSTPVPDIKLHLMAWRQHFASIFGWQALQRVKGFSPPEMHLPIHPDVCYAYVKALKECGYEWLMVQEHTIENLDGSGIRDPHLPHRLVAKNSAGEVVDIVAVVKTQGSDNKLIGQMQPFYEAQTLSRRDVAGKNIPPFVCQVGDGENGGVMMNEFPPAFMKTYNEMQDGRVVAMNGSEYIEFVKQAGLKESDFIPVQPISQHRIWQKVAQPGPHAADAAIDRIKQEDSSFNLDKGSWTNDKNWVKGYEDVLDPINQLSAAFHKKVDGRKIDTNSAEYRAALLHLLVSQTSCFRYWGSGVWTDYAKEICRRGMEAVKAL